MLAQSPDPSNSEAAVSLRKDTGLASTTADDEQPAGACGGVTDWVWNCVLDGLIHGACCHHQAHPDLAACIQAHQCRRAKASE